MIGCGDAAASLLSPALVEEFVLPYEKRVVEGIHQAGGLVKLHICGNSQHFLGQLVTNGADLYNVDHMVDLAPARRCRQSLQRQRGSGTEPAERHAGRGGVRRAPLHRAV